MSGVECQGIWHALNEAIVEVTDARRTDDPKVEARRLKSALKEMWDAENLIRKRLEDLGEKEI